MVGIILLVWILFGDDLNDKLASLQQRLLERDDESDPGGRIYRDKVSGEIITQSPEFLAPPPQLNSKPH